MAMVLWTAMELSWCKVGSCGSCSQFCFGSNINKKKSEGKVLKNPNYFTTNFSYSLGLHVDFGDRSLWISALLWNRLFFAFEIGMCWGTLLPCQHPFNKLDFVPENDTLTQEKHERRNRSSIKLVNLMWVLKSSFLQMVFWTELPLPVFWNHILRDKLICLHTCDSAGSR